MMDSIFTKIIKGEIPCHKVYEDDRVIAFLDIQPYTYGHTLVVPKEQIDHLWDLEDDLYQHVMSVVKQVANRQREVIKPKRIGMVLEGFAVPHAHVHVIPMNEGLEGTIEHEVAKPTNEQLADMAHKLAF
jgi:histidine triad (HIT) family protein